MLAPPWIPIPPPAYGGIESVVSLLTDELVRQGHVVTLLAAPGSSSGAATRALLAGAHPSEIDHFGYEVDHVARAFARIDAAREAGSPFDVVHDHCGWAALAMADRLSTPLVHTVHNPFSGDRFDFYAEHGRKGLVVSLSHAQRTQAPAELQSSPVIPNPIDVEQWPLRSRKDDYLLWIGRMSPDKGPQRAIEAARSAGRRLILAGPVQPGDEEFFATQVQPHLWKPGAVYVGEVGGGAKIELFASAAALLMPIRWPEPFGMVMVEALACGTPVISFPEGAAPEIVLPGENGFLVDDEAEMARAVGELGRIDPTRCRASAATRFDVRLVASRYADAYRQAATAGGGSSGAAAPAQARSRRRAVKSQLEDLAPERV